MEMDLVRTAVLSVQSHDCVAVVPEPEKKSSTVASFDSATKNRRESSTALQRFRMETAYLVGARSDQGSRCLGIVESLFHVVLGIDDPSMK